jgi:hypothetical protein
MRSMVERRATVIRRLCYRGSAARPSTTPDQVRGGPPPRFGEDHYAAFTGAR